MALDWSQCPAVESIPGKVSGAWVLRGTRTPVKVLFENLEAGMSIEEVIEIVFTREQLDSLMAFVARSSREGRQLPVDSRPGCGFFSITGREVLPIFLRAIPWRKHGRAVGRNSQMAT